MYVRKNRHLKCAHTNLRIYPSHRVLFLEGDVRMLSTIACQCIDGLLDTYRTVQAGRLDVKTLKTETQKLFAKFNGISVFNFSTLYIWFASINSMRIRLLDRYRLKFIFLSFIIFHHLLQEIVLLVILIPFTS